MLCHVCIDKRQKETCIKELGVENTVGDWSQLLRLRVLSHPLDKKYDGCFKNEIDCDDGNCNQQTQYLWLFNIIEVPHTHVLWGRWSILFFIFVHFIPLNLHFILVSTETLKNVCIVRSFMFFQVFTIHQVFAKSIVLPFFEVWLTICSNVLGLWSLAVCYWILHFQFPVLRWEHKYDRAWNEKHQDNNHGDDYLSPLSDWLCEVSVFPNDIRWLGSSFYLQLIS